jgi:hypothetical protein
MNSFNKVSKFDWADRLGQVLKDAEDAERELSYATACGSEHARKLSGSYYTPIDVSRYFWNEFFRLRGIEDPIAAQCFLNSHTFVEPSVGAGALFFALLEKLLSVGLDPIDVSNIRANLVDLNAKALEFIEQKIEDLKQESNVKFPNINYIQSDFLSCDFGRTSDPVMLFGNPPFVKNDKGTSPWKNSFADFFERSLSIAGTKGSVHLIVPLSIAFSRDYSGLRRSLTACKRTIALSHFDNIPDTLFKAGKPKHSNTNKANSQRCSIVSSMPSPDTVVLSTKLNRWSKKVRTEMLATPAQYIDVTGYRFDQQIPRPQNEDVFHYLQKASGVSQTISDHLDKNGRCALHIAGVARNFIGIRDEPGSSVNTLRFATKEAFHRVFWIVTSDLFLDYWLTVGDGFHVTRSNIMSFPIADTLLCGVNEDIPSAANLWRDRDAFCKSKLNSGVRTRSYDFSRLGGSLYPYIASPCPA